MDFNKETCINAGTNILTRIKKMPIDQDALISTAKEMLRDSFTKNCQFKYTEKDEKLFLKCLEESAFNHFYVRSDLLDREIKSITDKITTIFHDLYQKQITVRVLLTDNPEMKNNAWALPNGTILIDITLLQAAKYIDELYFIIAHESAHVLCRHAAVFQNIESISDKFLGGFLAKLRLRNTLGAIRANSIIRDALNLLKNQKIYPALLHSDEYEADHIAAKTLSSLNMDPAAGSKILIRLDNRDHAHLTHPKTSDRITRINEWVNTSFPEKTPSTPQVIPQIFKQQVLRAKNLIQQKRRLINTVSWITGGSAAFAIILLIYFIGTIPLSENGIINSLQFSFIYFLYRLIFYIGWISVPVIFYLVYEKTYHMLK